jgi:hypothetical protein
MKAFVLLVAALAFGCASTEKKNPEWTAGSTRVVDNGYIVYVGKGEASNAERAQFKAEGMALEDLANECSLIPKGARVEDRYSVQDQHEYVAWVKVAVEFQECDQGRHANVPGEIQKVANVPFTQQLRRYQELTETGEMPDASEAGESVEPPAEVAAAPETGSYPVHTHIFVTRQYVAYQKEIVVLAPPAAYAAGTPAARQFAQHVTPAAEHVVTAEAQNPASRGQAWSRVPDRPAVARPAALVRASHGGVPRVHEREHEVRPPGGYGRKGGSGSGAPAKRAGKRRHRR